MLDVIDNVKQRLPNYHYHYGFQNHDEIPLIKWTKPNIHEETHRIAQDLCERYLISGRISFTVDNVETLFDQAIEFKNDIENSLKQQKRKEVPIYVSKMFNKEHSFLNFMTDIVEESLSGEGDLVILK